MNDATRQVRRIVHIDMDAFYASVEQRDRPELRGVPVVVAWRGPRSVVCAASYEARRYGIYSAMPAARAERLCRHAVFVPPDFTRYRAVSEQVREIFHRHTDLVEPLSLDEAYLDVSSNRLAIPTATGVARRIRGEILQRTGLTASAGVAPNKFLAKIASDWRKPDGLFVIKPHESEAFLAPLPVRKLPGVGKATETSLEALHIETVAELRRCDLATLTERFGKFGQRLFDLARGVDHSAVKPDRPRKSLSAETTFEHDLTLDELEPAIRKAAARVWSGAAASPRVGQTIVLKLKTRDFHLITRSFTPASPPESLAELTHMALALLDRVALPDETRYRLAGVGLANFLDRQAAPMQASLFDSAPG